MAPLSAALHFFANLESTTLRLRLSREKLLQSSAGLQGALKHLLQRQAQAEVGKLSSCLLLLPCMTVCSLIFSPLMYRPVQACMPRFCARMHSFPISSQVQSVSTQQNLYGRAFVWISTHCCLPRMWVCVRQGLGKMRGAAPPSLHSVGVPDSAAAKSTSRCGGRPRLQAGCRALGHPESFESNRRGYSVFCFTS